MSTSPVTAELRLAPIERPPGLLVRLLQWYFRRRFGQPLLPLQVIHARMPRFIWPYLALAWFSEVALSLAPEVRHALSVRVSVNHGCDFCADLHRAMGLDAGHPAALLGEGSDAALPAATRAALQYADDVSRTGDAGDATFAALRGHFSERQVVEVAFVVAFTTFYNRLARPLGLSSQGFCELVQREQRRGEAPSL